MAWWAALAALWMGLTDTVKEPELFTGAAAAALGAIAAVLGRAFPGQGAGGALTHLRHSWRVVASVPLDVARLAVAAVAQLVRPREVRGAFHTLPFPSTGESGEDEARAALASGFGGFSPNTFVLGVDTERGVLLAHQLRPTGDPDDLDPLRLR